MSVIEHDFGLTKRATERRFGKLLTLDALHEAVEDPTLNRYGSDMTFADLSDEELFLSLKEVL